MQPSRILLPLFTLIGTACLAGTPDVWPDLVHALRQSGLPEPPTNAPLVRFQYGSSTTQDQKPMPLFYLGFYLEDRAPQDGGRILVGPVIFHALKSNAVEIVDPMQAPPAAVATTWRAPLFSGNVLLMTAIQCKTRGWNAFAESLLRESRHPSPRETTGPSSPAAAVLKTEFSCMAWDYWCTQLVQPNTDRRDLAQRLKALVTEYPNLRTVANRRLIGDLEATLVSSGAYPQTIESLIDKLPEVSGGERRFDYRQDPHYNALLTNNASLRALLIPHLADNRLTRTLGQIRPIRILRVSDLVQDLLESRKDRDRTDRPEVDAGPLRVSTLNLAQEESAATEEMKYRGELVNGVRQGKGTLRYENGDTYTGEFRDGVKHGKGVYHFHDGATYVGNFAHDKRNGPGEYSYVTGERFIGSFKEGKKHGVGVLVFPNGRQVKGTWQDDQLLEPGVDGGTGVLPTAPTPYAIPEL